MTFKECKKIAKARMGEKRFTHSENVADEAEKLAEIYGADKDKAKLAGILHDITKETPNEEQLQIIRQNGIILTKMQLSSPKLWHSISGAAFIESELKIKDEDIINAVRYHTSGRAGMSLLEKIIFVADFTSEERSYDGVEIMRKKSRKSLEEAMYFGLSFTLSDLIKRERTIEPNAVACYNDIILNYKF